VTPRHAKPDPVGIALGVLWTAGSALVIVILAAMSGEPCPCDPAHVAGRTPVSVPDRAPPDTL
jgi:hypothetical protein